MLGDDARGSVSFDPNAAGRPSVTSYAYGLYQAKLNNALTNSAVIHYFKFSSSQVVPIRTHKQAVFKLKIGKSANHIGFGSVFTM